MGDISQDALGDLLKALDSLTFDKYTERFETISTTYRFQNEEALRADVLVPRRLTSSVVSVPVMIRIHGGFMITGSSLYPPWFNTWILDYAHINNAIIISPDYRLLPEVSGYDILDDMEHFWSWVQGGQVEELLHANGYEGLNMDFNRLLLVGESAGGYLATQLALTHFTKVRALVALYPMLDLKSRFYTESYPKPIIRVTNRPIEIVEKHVKSMQGWQSRCDPPKRLELAFSVVQNGRFLDFFEGNAVHQSQSMNLYPFERLDDPEDADGLNEGSNLPEMFIFHGEQDSAVPVESTRAFLRKIKECRKNARANFHFQDGDHGFDFDATLETPWLAQGLEPITTAWLEHKNFK